MPLTDEQQRALDYQARQARIAANQRALASRLIGPGSERQALQERWQPLILARREAMNDTGAGGPEEEDDDGEV